MTDGTETGRRGDGTELPRKQDEPHVDPVAIEDLDLSDEESEDVRGGQSLIRCDTR